MKQFLDDNFLLTTQTAEELFHGYASAMPILDYHNHLPPVEIAQDKKFRNITQAWLKGDHYKWRAMRSQGIDEHFITGKANDFEKFEKWAETVPYTIGNPLFHWTHLELKTIFGITELLTPASARTIYENTSHQLQTDLSVRNILSRFNVKSLCTTDDPLDNLEFHQQLKKEKYEIQVLPTFRPDKTMAVDNVADYNRYLDALGLATGTEINSWSLFLKAIENRHDFFHQIGCRLSDHGLETFYAEDFTESSIAALFLKIKSGQNLDPKELLTYKSACLLAFAELDASKNWTQQFHIGAIRNNNSRLYRMLGADSGADSIGDVGVAHNMSRFFDKLDSKNKLARTIVYNLNPSQNEVFASMMGNFNDGTIMGKMQYGAAWWFLDQKDGIESQLKTLANMGQFSHFVGMLTDSRSFLSFPRHEYFRRTLCSFLGKQMEDGELPSDINWLGKTVQDICYNNAVKYFQF